MVAVALAIFTLSFCHWNVGLVPPVVITVRVMVLPSHRVWVVAMGDITTLALTVTVAVLEVMSAQLLPVLVTTQV